LFGLERREGVARPEFQPERRGRSERAGWKKRARPRKRRSLYRIRVQVSSEGRPVQEMVTDRGEAIQEALWERLVVEGRGTMERLLNRMMEAERMVFLGCAPYERTRVRRGRRNGYDGRQLDSRWGRLRLRVPKVRDAAEPFRPRALRAYQRRQRALERCAVEWVAAGMSTRAVSREMRRAFGAVV